MCGLTINASTYPWLHTNTQWFLMSGNSSREDSEWGVVYTGALSNYLVTGHAGGVSAQGGMRPVVSLSNSVRIVDGDGTTDNPYTVSLN